MRLGSCRSISVCVKITEIRCVVLLLGVLLFLLKRVPGVRLVIVILLQVDQMTMRLWRCRYAEGSKEGKLMM